MGRSCSSVWHVDIRRRGSSLSSRGSLLLLFSHCGRRVLHVSVISSRQDGHLHLDSLTDRRRCVISTWEVMNFPPTPPVHHARLLAIRCVLVCSSLVTQRFVLHCQTSAT